MIDHATFLNLKSWRMIDDRPTFGLTVRIIWRPVAVCAWEIVVGERGLCSLPRFTRADDAKADAWPQIKALEKAHAD